MRSTFFAAFLAVASVAAAQALKVPFIQQQKNGCGAASVAMVMSYWNASEPSGAAVYATLFDPALNGIQLVSMKHYLAGHGFRAYTVRGQRPLLEDHLAKGRPVIVALRKKARGQLHFAVVTGITREEVMLNDPTRTRLIRLKHKEFEKRWQQAGNWALLATPALPTAEAPPVSVSGLRAHP